MKATNKILSLAVCAIALVSATGCSLNSLAFNIWEGFGNGIGYLPANIITDFIASSLGLQ